MVSQVSSRSPNWIAVLNGRRHEMALSVFMFVVLAHLIEHIAQAIQIWALGWNIPDARGVLGLPFPWLIKSEWLHYGYAIVMLVALWLLRKGFVGRSRWWWNLALGIQVWHHFEHLLLLIQASTGIYLAGRTVPTSIVQLVVPRVELHLFYNTVVLVPMIISIVLHRHASPAERAHMSCTCAVAAARTNDSVAHPAVT